MIFPAPNDYAREAAQHVEAYADDERCRRMTAWEALWIGRAYEGKPSFWKRDVALMERAPAVQTGIIATAGRRLANMVFGERSFPGVDIAASTYGVMLSDEEREALSALASEIVTAAKLRARARSLVIEGLKVGSACALCELSAGKPSVRLIPAKWCTPTLDESGAVVRLVVSYKVTRDGDEYVFRRVLGDGFDTTYKLARIVTGKPIDWSKVPVEGEPRAITFVPAVWVRNAPEAVEDGYTLDGHPMCEGLEDELLALDLELSQLLRNAFYNGDPQMVRAGDGKPMGTGGTATPPSDQPLWSLGVGAAKHAWQRLVGNGAPQPTKGPGTVWDLGQGGDAKLLESSGAGAQIIKGAFDELRRVIVDNVGVVLADPQTLGGGELSARALTLLFGPMLDTASALRVDYGDALCSILAILMRLAAEQPEGVYLSTIDAARPALGRLYSRRTDGALAFLPPPLALAWGEFFEPSWSDVSAAIDAASKATGGRAVLSQRAAMRFVGPVVGVEDLDAEADELDRELGGDTAAMKDALGALAPQPDAPAVAPVEAVADTALNGAQIDALVALAEKVALRTLPLESAVRIAIRAFQLSDEEARAMLSPAAEAPPPAAAPATSSPPVSDGPRPLP